MDPIEITLSKKTPGVAELTGAWEDGGVYPGYTITQVKSDDGSVTLSLMPEMSEEAEPATPPPGPKKPSMKVQYEG